MKADIHPDYHQITVVQTDGTEFKTFSCYGKEGDILRLDIDPLTHPAWTGGTGKVVEKGQLNKFESKYGNMFSSAPKADEKQEDKQ